MRSLPALGRIRYQDQNEALGDLAVNLSLSFLCVFARLREISVWLELK